MQGTRRVKRYGHGGDPLRILLVQPRGCRNLWSLDGVAAIFGARALMPSSALATLMALTPDDVNVEYRLCDENIENLDWNIPCDLAAITGNTHCAERMMELCRAFRSRGIPVAIGGPFPTLEAQRCQGMADHHFKGEAEYTWPRFLRDLALGQARASYEQAAFVDLADSPAPDWSLVDPGHYVQIGVQTCRGCPNRCDFCDVLRYVGQRPRVKSVEQVLREVENARALGLRSLFLSDDNFLARPRHAREVLRALAAWNTSLEDPVSFSTQLTVDVADDDELLRLLAQAGLRFLFLGVETVREAGLREVNKVQNLRGDLRLRLRRLVRHGLVAILGIIVGFDADDEGIFDELEGLLVDTDSLLLASSLLNAPPGTPLHDRLLGEGRLTSLGFSGEWQMASNVRFQGRTAEDLVRQNLAFLRRVYEPRRFFQRFEGWIRNVMYFGDRHDPGPDQIRQFLRFGPRFFGHVEACGEPEVQAAFRRALKQVMRHEPRLLFTVVEVLAQYWHFHQFVKNASIELSC